MSSHDELVTELLSWLRANNVWMDDRLRITRANSPDSDGGLGVYASARIPFGIAVAKTPKSSVLSLRACARAEILQPLLVDTDPNITLTVAVLCELLLGARSRWWGYLRSFPPEGADIAMFWDGAGDDGREAVQWLEGTEASRIINGDLQTKLDVAYNEVVLTALKDLQPTKAQFRIAYSYVSSRAFHVDTYHQVGLVPVADAFNHAEDNTVYMETDFSVCPECGSLGECPHDGYNSAATAESGEMTCDMVTCAEIRSGDEVFNSYDDGLKNADLLCHYGFTLEGNSKDAIIWKQDELTVLGAYSEDALRSVELASRTDDSPVDSRSIWMRTIDELDELEGPDPLQYSVDAEGRISFPLWLYLFARNAPCPAEDLGVLLHLVSSLLRTIENAEAEPSQTPFADVPADALRTLLSVAQDVRTLCEGRRRAMYRPDLTTSDIASMLDAQQGRRTRLAMAYTLTERIMLETCAMAWEEIQDFVQDLVRA